MKSRRKKNNKRIGKNQSWDWVIGASKEIRSPIHEETANTGWSPRTVLKYSSFVTRLALIETSAMIWLKDNSSTFFFSKTDWIWKIILGVKCKKFQNRTFAKLQISIKSASFSVSKLKTISLSFSLKYWLFGDGFWRINKTERFEIKRSFLA